MHAEVLARLALLLLLALPAAAREQAELKADLEGTPVNLVLPPGYCKVDPKKGNDALFHAAIEKLQRGRARLLLVFSDCIELERFRHPAPGIDPGLDHFGYYAAMLEGGAPRRKRAGQTRAEALAGIEASIHAGQAQVRRLGRDGNAVYVGVGSVIPSAAGASRHFAEVHAFGVPGGMAIFSVLYEPGGDALFPRLLEKQQALAAELARRNPD